MDKVKNLPFQQILGAFSVGGVFGIMNERYKAGFNYIPALWVLLLFDEPLGIAWATGYVIGWKETARQNKKQS